MVRTPRGRNSPDDVIESGEIVVGERRSLVIRAATPPAAFDEPTEVSAPVYTPPPAPRRSLWVVMVGVLAGLACVGGIITAVLSPASGSSTASPTPIAPSDLDAAAGLIGSTLDASRHSAMVHVESIASSPALKMAIETDAATLADMMRDRDWSLNLQPGEIVEVVQVRDKQRTVLMRSPERSGELPGSPPGIASLASRDGVFGVVARAEVRTKDVTRGEVVLWSPIDRSALSVHLPRSVSAATIEGLGKPISLIGTLDHADVHVAIPSKLEKGASKLSLAAAVPAAAVPVAITDGSSLTIARNLLFALAGLLLLIALIGVVVRRRSA